MLKNSTEIWKWRQDAPKQVNMQYFMFIEAEERQDFSKRIPFSDTALFHNNGHINPHNTTKHKMQSPPKDILLMSVVETHIYWLPLNHNVEEAEIFVGS